jgi:hypothetical protein
VTARRIARILASPLLACSLAACTTGANAREETPAPPPAAKVDVRNPFNPARPYVFGGGNPADATVTRQSRRLATGLRLPDGVRVIPLASTPQTAAVEVLERDPPGNFGDLLAAGQRAVFDRFARDRSLGPWLIVISALEGQGSAIAPPVVDRWTRASVEAYARCGIPASGSNLCKQRFFSQSREAMIHQGGGRGAGA